LAQKALCALADVHENYGVDAEDHRGHGRTQQETEDGKEHLKETEDGKEHLKADGGLGKQVAACPAARLEVLELAHQGGVFPLKLALQVPQRVTVRSFNIGMVIYFRV
jgi:hypothetical protein